MSDDKYRVGEKSVEVKHIGDTMQFKAMVLDNLEKPTSMPHLTIWSDTEKGWCMAVSQEMMDNPHTKQQVAARILEVVKRLRLFEIVSQHTD